MNDTIYISPFIRTNEEIGSLWFTQSPTKIDSNLEIDLEEKYYQPTNCRQDVPSTINLNNITFPVI
jgi:hypothetical protein